MRTEIPADKNLDELNILKINSGLLNVTSGAEPFNIATPNFSSVGELRQDIALKLNEIDNAIITNIRFTIFFEKTYVEISTLPSSLRGAFSGLGDFNFEFNIIKNGMFI